MAQTLTVMAKYSIGYLGENKIGDEGAKELSKVKWPKLLELYLRK